MIPELSIFLLLIIEGCMGASGDPLNCTGKNISLRVPYESYAQCQAASRQVTVPGGAQQYVRGVCMAVPTATLAPATGTAPIAQEAPAVKQPATTAAAAANKS
jgi:hypothetical protein